MKTKITLGIVTVVAVVGVLAAMLLAKHHSQTDFPKSSWASAGYAAPAAALVTTLDAASRGDGEKIFASLSPDMQQRFQNQFQKQVQAQGISITELLAGMGSHWTKGATGFQIVRQETVSDDLTILHVQLQGKDGDQTFKMKKIGNDWKLDDFSENKHS